ncbi:MAG: aldehyde dehydrogenase, partial [Candidatus Tectomicrobia bacterium]
CIFDNEHYGETGMQVTFTARTADLAATAAALGIPITGTIIDETQLETALPIIREAEGPIVKVIKVRTEQLDFALPEKDGAYLKTRFRLALLGDSGVS